LQGWLNDKHAILDEDVLISRRGVFELSVSARCGQSFGSSFLDWKNGLYSPVSTKFRLLGPHFVVETLGKVFREHRTVVVVGDTLQTVVDQETRETKTDEDTDDGDDGDPFLFRILLQQPWLLDFALPYSPRVEVALVRGSDARNGASGRGRDRYRH